MAVLRVDAHHPVAQCGAEVRSQEEVDDEVGGGADDDEHVADVVSVRDGMRTAKQASLVSQDRNRHLHKRTV